MATAQEINEADQKFIDVLENSIGYSEEINQFEIIKGTIPVQGSVVSSVHVAGDSTNQLDQVQEVLVSIVPIVNFNVIGRIKISITQA